MSTDNKNFGKDQNKNTTTQSQQPNRTGGTQQGGFQKPQDRDQQTGQKGTWGTNTGTGGAAGVGGKKDKEGHR